MAAFTDPFERHDPFNLQTSDLFGGRLGAAVDASTDLLARRSVADIRAIARAVSVINDAAILDLAQQEPYFGPARDQWPDASDEEIASLDADYDALNPAMLRDDLGELGVFLSVERDLCQCDGSDGQVAFERSEALAVIALWLATECIEEVVGQPRLAPPGYDDPFMPVRTYFPAGHPQHGRPPQDTYASVLALDAMRASMLAVEARERSANRAAMQADGVHAQVLAEMEQRDEAVRRDRSERAVIASQARWEPKKLLMAKALAIARAGNFPSFTRAAEAIEDHVPREPNGTKAYTAETIISWLQKAGWRPTKPPPKRRRKG